MDDPQSGNTFDGFLHEFPGVRIDAFDNKESPYRVDTQFYLLTHAHQDHLKGLSQKTFKGRKIYCSETTREVLKTDQQCRHLIPYLTPLRLNMRHKVSYGRKHILISLMLSNHCAGSVMFLIEQDRGKNILCTGDIRAEKWWIDTVAKNPLIFSYTTHVRTLDNIYLDTTYGYRQEPFIAMQDNYQGLRLLAFILDIFPKGLKSEDIAFYFQDDVLGFEDVWVQMGLFFREKFHISKKNIYERTTKLSQQKDYELASQLKEVIGDAGSKFHLCGKMSDLGKCPRTSNVKFKVRIKACIDVDLETVFDFIKPRKRSAVDNLTLQETLSEGSRVYSDHDGIHYLQPQGTDTLLTSEILYFYSRHSSYEETRNFVDLLRPQQVYPITESSLTWVHGFQMQRHFGDLCVGSSYIYDEMCKKSDIYPPAPIKARKPQSQNRYNPHGSFYENLNTNLSDLESFKISFRGIQQIKTAFPEDASSEDKRMEHDYTVAIEAGKRIMGCNQYRVQRAIQQDTRRGLSALTDIGDDYSERDANDTESQEGDDPFCDWSREEEKRKRELDSARIVSTNIRKNESTIQVPTGFTTQPNLPSQEPIIITSDDDNDDENKDAAIKILNSLSPGLTDDTNTVDRSDPEISLHLMPSVNLDSHLETHNLFTVNRKLNAGVALPYKKKTKLNKERINKIERIVKHDIGDGFFQFELKCTKLPMKRFIDAEIKAKNNH